MDLPLCTHTHTHRDTHESTHRYAYIGLRFLVESVSVHMCVCVGTCVCMCVSAGEATQNSNDAWRRRSAEPSSWRARSPLSVGPAAPSGMATPPQNEWGAHAQSKRAVVMSRFGLTLRE